MNISKNVQALTPEELSQAVYLHQKNRKAFEKTYSIDTDTEFLASEQNYTV